MDQNTVHSKVKEIKQSFRLMMDGAVAQSMRDKGLDYHLNWGATIPRLQAKAEEIRESLTNNHEPITVNHEPLTLYDLSIALYKENVRECKILASMLMPPDEILPEVVDIWQEQIPSQEIAEQLAFNLYQHLPYAPEKAYQWIASDKEYDQLCGFHILTRLFMNRQEPNERGINEFLDQALCALQGPFPAVRKAAMQSLQRFAELGILYERLAKNATKSIHLDIF
jgi:hypothetical protein